MSCSRITNDYDGITHDYTGKTGLIFQNIYLTENAPKEWSDRSVLWNTVEEAEKTKDSRLAREFIIALPVEFSLETQIRQVETFVRKLVSDGMCADVCIHDTDGHNPHAHIMTTVRPLNLDGSWQNKTEKEYLCIRNGEERGFTSAEFKFAQLDGWEKQYLYLVNGKKKYLPASTAEGLDRVNKYPKGSRYGRQNPISKRWNSEEQLIEWRKLWADIVNKDFEKQYSEERIEYRSFAVLGIKEQPTVHEGAASKAMKKKGQKSDRSYINSLIRKDNELIRSLTNTIKYLTEAVMLFIPKLADALESLRVNMIILEYNIRSLGYYRRGEECIVNEQSGYVTKLEDVTEQIRNKESALKSAKKKLKLIPKIASKSYNALRCEVEKLTFELEELQCEQRYYLYNLDCDDENSLEKARQKIDDKKQNILSIDAEEKKLSDEFESTLNSYRETEKQVENANRAELITERKRIRPHKEDEAKKALDVSDSDKEFRFNRSVDAVSKMIGEEPPRYLTKREIYQKKEYDRWLKEQEERENIITERYKKMSKSKVKNDKEAR